MKSEIIDICTVSELPPGGMKMVEWEDLEIGVFNCNGEIYAIEDRCSHDNGTLVEGTLDQEKCTVECPRHGSRVRPEDRQAHHAAGLRAGRDVSGARGGGSDQGGGGIDGDS